MEKILFISTRFPYPIFSGDKSRSFDILKFLSKKNKVHLVCLEKENEIYKKNLSFCAKIKTFKLSFIARIIKATFSMLKLEPLQNGFYLSNEMKNYINSVADQYDTIICHLLRSSQYMPNNYNGKKVLEMSDLQSLAYQQLIKQLSVLNPVKYVYIFEKFLVEKYEKKTFKNFHNIVFVSNKDAREANKKISIKKNHVIEMAKNFNSNLYKYKKNNYKIIFIGNIKFIPNKIACNDFVKNVLGLINLKYPKISFHVIGNIGYLNKIFLKKYKNVVVHGKVKNLKNVMKNSICGLCNVKVSTGFQSKILTYMSFGIPTVLSNNSFVNTGLKKNKEVLVFKNNKQLKEKIFYLLNNKKIAEQLSRNSEKIIKKKYNRDKILSKYDKII